MQITRSVMTNNFPRILSVVVVLLLIGGLHPIQSFADITSSPDTSDTTTSSVPSVGDSSDTPLSNDPSNSSNTSNDNSDTVNNNLDAANQTNSSSTTGDATVTDNTDAGDATSGDAQADVNSLNIVASTTNLDNGYSATLFYDVTGNDQTNLIINPAAPDQTPGNTIQSPEIVNLDSVDSGQINNDINLISTSGNASVNDNGTAGNATSGNADVAANVINLVNDEVMAQQTFLGVVNIYGNLTGDILLPSQLLDNLSSENSTPELIESTPALTITDNTQSISNAVNASANSGNASVENNNIGGSASSGKATTNINSMDLINNDVTGSNVMIVFINVLGSWVGEFMNAPAGTTSGVLGGTLAQSPVPNSNYDVSSTTNSVNNSQINNTIDASTLSGNADVSNNNIGGNATSGDASTGVNILNIANSDYALSNWFGVLFINVFGTWNGSLNVESPTTNTTPPGTTTPPVSVTSTPAVIKNIQNGVVYKQVNIQPPIQNHKNKSGHVLGASTIKYHAKKTYNKLPNSNLDSIMMYIIMIIILLLAILALVLRIRKSNQTISTISI